MTWSPPRTFEEWEQRLVQHFLTVGQDGDASDIRSFEVTACLLYTSPSPRD